MASIFASGTGCAARISALAACLALLPANAPPSATGELDVKVEGLRSAKSMIRACLTRESRFFPHCEKDPNSLKLSVAAGTAPVLHFVNLAPGDYALTVLHDENSNFRADMMLGIPREGVGFSRNPRLVMSAPSFNAVRFSVAGTQSMVVQLKYFL